MRACLLLFLLAACAVTASEERKILGAKPALRIWAPALDEGWTPQGLTIVANHFPVSAYQDTDPGLPKCRVFRLEMATGAPAGHFDMPEPCRHAGGITDIGGGYVVVADTRQDWKVDADNRLWAISEAGARKYHNDKEQDVPVIFEIDVAKLK